MLLTENKEFDIFVASKIGSFKHIKYNTDATKNTKKHIENLVDIKSLQKDDSITCLEWGNNDQTEILMGRKNQQIQLYDTLQGFTTSYKADFGTGDIIGLGRCKRKLLAALSSGVVKIWSKKEESILKVGEKLDCMRICRFEHCLFATGGEENDLKVHRIGEQSPIFVAKNLAHDWLQLRRPVWVTDLTFLDDVNTIAVCSRHGYIRLYDTRAQRRPVCNIDCPNMAATCITSSFEDSDWMCIGSCLFTYRHLSSGLVMIFLTFTATIPDEKLIVSASLDRHLRIHKYDSKELVYKQYLTSKLTRILTQTVTSTPLRSPPSPLPLQDTELKQEDDMDELFDNMETVGDREKPKKKKTEIEEPEIKKIKPSIEGSTEAVQDKNEAIAKLLRSTEKQKRRLEKRKKEKRAKSVFHNA
ncbi:WD repeat-containing protein 74 [Hyposmocoma kahamanoa]|uniref:WD repeat-containing protein 74 n=1 Tax=Hyposmocoma kahamanoa TaxID=1477025 RepID=UPI000E6D6FBC|nr:WD repeat-containing protein 74 [Hyposmocoma kahamanoa]